MITNLQLRPIFEELFVTALRSSRGIEEVTCTATNILEQTVERLNFRLLNCSEVLPEHIVLIRQIVRWSGRNIFVEIFMKTF